jgi:cyclohexyl-isocyanide hydratase
MTPSPTASPTPFRVGFLVFPGLTQLDLTGPHEAFSRVPGAELRLYWKVRKPVHAACGLALTPTHRFGDDGALDLLCVPGGPGQIALMTDPRVLDWLRATAARATWVTSVCTGALVLAAAGLLDGYRATTHWSALEDLESLGATPRRARVVVDRNRITGAGVTSGLDFALHVIGALFGEARAREIQLRMEYDPAPPWGAVGTPATADPGTLAAVQAALEDIQRTRRAATWAAVDRRRRGRAGVDGRRA